MGFQKILVAIDNSQSTQAIFEQGLGLALLAHGNLMLLHCLAIDLIGEPMVPIPIELGLYPEMIDSSYDAWHICYENKKLQGQAILRHYCEIAIQQGVYTEFDLSTGEPSLCLCQTAKNWGADLIVLGRRGRTGLTEALLGSVSNYVLHHAPCSVLVVQAEQANSAQKLPANVAAGQTRKSDAFRP